MATKTLNTRIALKTDTTANWTASTLVLLKGEQVIEITEFGEYKIKIGDGVKTFKDLPYATLTQNEITKLITSGAIQSVSLATGTNNGTVKLTVDGTVTDNIAVKGLGSAAYTNSGAYATAGHGHSISGISGLQAALNNKSAVGHTHDDRYYTESEMNTKLAGKANSSHTHGSGDITSLDASKLTGTINIDRLPAGALERCMIVADDAARLKLTTKDVQKGDTVKVTATGKMYFVIDDSKLDTEDGYTVYTAGSATSVPWSGVTGKPTTFTPSAHKHTKSDITDFPTSMVNPNSITVTLNGGTTEGTNKFTYNGGSAKTINITPGNIGAAASSHSHSISNITNLQSILDAKAENSTLTNQNLNSVTTPGFYTAGGSNACTNKPSNVDNFGLIVIHRANGAYYTQICFIDNISYRRFCNNGTWTSWTQDKLTDTNTWRGIQNNLTSDSTDQSLSAAQGKALKALIDGKAAASHTHSISNISGLQTALDGKSNNGHTHNYAGAASAGGNAYNANALALNPPRATSLNYDLTSNTYAKRVTYSIASKTTAKTGTPPVDGHMLTFGWDTNDGWGSQLIVGDGSEAHLYVRGASSTTVNDKKTTSWDQSWRTVLDSSNYTSYTVTKTGSGASGTWGISISGNAATSSKCTGNAATATVADSAKSCTGNSATATKLATARKIGNASFDGTADITLAAIGAASSGHTHNYAGSSSAGGAANSAIKLSTARNFSITGGAAAAAVSFDGSAAVALNVTSVSTDVLNNGANTLIFNCGGA